MNKKQKTLLWTIIFIAFIGISYFIYYALSNKYNQDIDSAISSQMEIQSAISSQMEDESIINSDLEQQPISSLIDIIPPVSSLAEIKPPISSKPAVSSKTEIKPPVSSKAEVKEAPPDFTVFNSKGNKVKLSDFLGKPIVLNFWASWCPPCKEEMPGFNNQYAKVKNDVVFMMVDLVDGQRETQAKGQKYYDSQGYSFPIYFDNEQQAAKAYSISSIPTTFFINSNGKIVKTQRGSMTEEKFAEAIELIKD